MSPLALWTLVDMDCIQGLLGKTTECTGPLVPFLRGFPRDRMENSVVPHSSLELDLGSQKEPGIYYRILPLEGGISLSASLPTNLPRSPLGLRCTNKHSQVTKEGLRPGGAQLLPSELIAGDQRA